MDLEDDDLDALDAYRAIIDEVIAGRVEGHHCPACREGELECRFDGTRITISCPNCGKFFEGELA